MPGTSTIHTLWRSSYLVDRCFWLTLLFGCVILPVARAQDCCGITAPAAPESEWSFRKEVNEVNVLFVAKRHGKFVSDLAQSDITVVDDSKPAKTILGFRTERNLALRVGLLIDTSDSLTGRFSFEQAAASAFLRHVLSQSDDLAFVLGFSGVSRLTQDFTHDPDVLSQGVKQLAIGGETALYDAVGVASDKLRTHSGKDNVARILVILSDGENNTGTLDLNGAIESAQQAEVSVYAISTRYERVDLDHQRTTTKGDLNLRKLAEDTGGLLLRPDRPKDVPSAFAEVVKELRARYAISYRPVDFTSDGHYRTIKIEARKNGKRLKVRARKGYFARGVGDTRLAKTEESRSFPHSLREH